MTRDGILNMEAGPELDAIVAERVMGWRRMYGPRYDYDGVLVPPRISDKQFNHFQFPPRGPIAFGFFGIPKYSASIADAWEVVEKMHSGGFRIVMGIEDPGDPFEIGMNRSSETRDSYGVFVSCHSAPLAICRAALIATLEDE